MQLTITDGADGLATVDVDLDAPMENIQALIGVELSIPAEEQVLLVDGKPMSGTRDPGATLRSCGLAGSDSILLVTRNQQGPQRDQSPAFGLEAAAENLLEQVRSNPQILTRIAADGARELAERLAARDKAGVIRILEHESRIQQDIFSVEAQQAIEHRIQSRNLEENLAAGLEHNPEAFADVIMLYVDTKLNSKDLVAFVDTGAQRTIISAKCAEEFGLTRLIDKRMGGVARGVGTGRIVGRIHLVVLEVAGVHLECSMSVLEHCDMDFILGLDMLRKHRAVIDLKQNQLHIQERSTNFLAEKDIPDKFKPEKKP